MENTRKRIGRNLGCDICKLMQSGLLQNDLTGQQSYPSLKLQLVKTERMLYSLWRSCPKSGKSAFHQNFENNFLKLRYLKDGSISLTLKINIFQPGRTVTAIPVIYVGRCFLQNEYSHRPPQ